MSTTDATAIRGFLLAMKMAVAGGRWQLADRKKNLADLTDLGMALPEVADVLRRLTVDDYCDGPLPDDKGRSKEWWVFGPRYAGETLYVKVCLNRFQRVECLSFHRAQHPMVYPFRKGGDQR